MTNNASTNEKVEKNKILRDLIDNVDIKDVNFFIEFKNKLTTYTDVIATSSNELKPSKFKPYIFGNLYQTISFIDH